MAEFLVDVKPQDEWKRKITKEELLDEMKTALDSRSRASSRASRSRSATTCSRASRRSTARSSIKVFGDDPDVLRRQATEVLRAMSARPRRGARLRRPRRPGAAAADRNRPRARRALRAQRRRRRGRDRDRARRQGRRPRSGKASGGSASSSGCRSSERRDIDGDQQASSSTRPAGRACRWPTSPTSPSGSGSMNIAARSGTRVAAIGVFIRGRDMGSIVDEMQQQRRKATCQLPPGYYATWGGEFENQQRAMARLRVIVPISVLLIFVLLFNAFGSVQERRADPRQRPVRADRRHPRAVSDRHPPERVGGDRLHRALRPGGAQRRGDGQLLQPTCGRRASAPSDAVIDGSLCACARC